VYGSPSINIIRFYAALFAQWQHMTATHTVHITYAKTRTGASYFSGGTVGDVVGVRTCVLVGLIPYVGASVGVMCT
jgi:hypothetical protein